MSRPSAAPRYYESEHELQRLREELYRPRGVLRKHQSSSSRPRDLQLVEDPPASSSMLAWVDRFVAPPPPTSPTLKSAPPIGRITSGTLHVQVSPDDSTYRIRNIRPDGARTHVRRPSAQDVQDRLRQLPSANNAAGGVIIGNLPMRSNSFNRRASNHLPPSPAVPIAPVRRHQPGTADLNLRLNVQDVNPVWDGSQDRIMVERGGGPIGGAGIGPMRPPLIRALPPPRPPRPSDVNLFDDDLPNRPPPLSLSSSTSSSSSSGQSSRNPSPQTPTSPATPSAWTSYYTDRGNDANSEQQQQVEPPLPPLPAPMARSPPASMGFGRRAKSPPAFSTRPVRPTVNLTGGTTASGSLTSIGNLMTTTSPIPSSPIPESTLRALGLDLDNDDDDDSSSPFGENALNVREEERAQERELRRSASTATTRRRERSLPPPPEPVQEERGRQNALNRRERSRPPRPELAQEEPERQNAFNRRERSQPPPPEPAQEEPERQNAFSRLRDFTRARSKSLSGRDSSRRRRTPSPPSRAPPLPTSPLVSTPNSARTIRAPGSPRPLYHMDFLNPHTDGDNNGLQSRPHSVAVSESSVITAGGTRYNIRNKALRVVNTAPSATSGSSRGSIVSRSSLGSTITALFSHSTSSKSSVSDKTTTSSSKSSERLESLKARALEEDIYRALNLPHVPYYSPSPSSRGDSPLPPPSFTFQDYCSSPRSSILSSPSSPRAKYAGINVDPQNRLEFDVRRTLEDLSLVEEEVWGKGRVQAWEKEPDLENTDDAAMGLETLIRVERKKRGKTRPERRGPIALRVPRR